MAASVDLSPASSRASQDLHWTEPFGTSPDAAQSWEILARKAAGDSESSTIVPAGEADAAAPIEGIGPGPTISFYTPDGHVRALRDIEADVILFAVGAYGGSLSETARRLGVGRSTLYRKLECLGFR